MLPETHTLRPAQEFLLVLFQSAPADSWVEFCAMRSDQAPAAAAHSVVEFALAADLERAFDLTLAEWAARWNRQKYHVYFGATPRTRRRTYSDGRFARSKDEDVEVATSAWVDFDTADWRDRVREVPQAPSILVASGRGGHAYWLYRAPRPAKEASEECKALARLYGGDSACHNVSRLLRLPGTTNWKTADGLPCALVVLDADARYDTLGDTREDDSGLNGVGSVLRMTIVSGVTAAPDEWRNKGNPDDRSNVDYHVMRELFLLGWSEERVRAIFTDPAYGIAEKCVGEEARGNRNYLSLTVRKALQAADTERARRGVIGAVAVFQTARELAAIQRPVFAVEGLLPVGGLALISGSAKCGKSLLAVDLALSLAGGEGAFLDRFPVNVAGPVVYCQAEVGLSSLKARFDAIGAARGIVWEELPLLFYNCGFDLGMTQNQDALAAGLQRARARFLIVDPLARYHMGDENKIAEMRLVLGGIDRVVREAGLVAAFVVHHHGKPTEAAREGVHLIRGSSIIGDWGNAHVILQKRFSDASGKKYIRFSFELRDAEEPAPVTMALDPETLRFREFSPEEERLVSVMDIAREYDAAPREELVARIQEEAGIKHKNEAERLLRTARARLKFGVGDGDAAPGKEGGNGSPENPSAKA